MTVRISPTTEVTETRLASAESSITTLQTSEVDEHVICRCTPIALQTLGSKANTAMNGGAGKAFVPSRCFVIVTAVGGGSAHNGDAEIKLGTTDGGAEIMATHLVSLTGVGQTAVINMDGSFPAIAGNATIYAECSKADTNVAANMTVTVYFTGRQF